MEEAVSDPHPEMEQQQQPPPLQNGDSDERCAKKPKFDQGAEFKRVAEIVLVLSTMATVRAGRKPSDAEVELMREARAKLASLCEGLAPKDIVTREAIGTVIEDLGLNFKLKDQRLGFRTPKMSIAERYSHAKWKVTNPLSLALSAQLTLPMLLTYSFCYLVSIYVELKEISSH